MKNITKIIDFIKMLRGVSKDRDVAYLLKMTGAALSNHKIKGTIPYQNLIAFCYANLVSVDSLLSDDEPLSEKAGLGSKPDFTETLKGVNNKDKIIRLQEELLTSQKELLQVAKNEILQLKQKKMPSPFGLYVDDASGRMWVLSAGLDDDAPDFAGESTQGTIEFHKYLGDGWGILFSHPKDYTPICTTELGRIANLKSEFAKFNVKVLSLSIDTVESHFAWINDINETQGCTVDFPIIADPDRKIALMYNMIRPNAKDTMTVRSVFIIGPDKKIKLIITYPISTGRNFAEILRTIESLQLTEKYEVGTPADWKPGEDCMVMPSVKKEEDIDKKFPNAHKAINHYMRYVPQPAMVE